MNNNLSESQTKINLLRAFAGESQAETDILLRLRRQKRKSARYRNGI